MGTHAAADIPPMPAAITSAVAARQVRHIERVPLPALAAAAAVIVAGAALVLFRAPVTPPQPLAGNSGGAGPVTLLSIMERYNRAGSIDAALNTPASHAGLQPSDGPVVRAIDARSGQLPE
jgi:hypothetical protein